MGLVLKTYSNLYCNFFFCIGIGNESEDDVSPDLVRILQSDQVRYGATIGFLHCVMCPSLIWVCFFLKTIYFFSVQFSLNELC